MSATSVSCATSPHASPPVSGLGELMEPTKLGRCPWRASMTKPTFSPKAATLALALVLLALAAVVPSTPASASVPPDLKVAFIGAQGNNANSRAVLTLIKNEGAALVMHQGDFDYGDNPTAWDNNINTVLGSNFPYFASVGNHDVTQWAGYQQKLQERLARIPGATCTGDLGTKAACHYQGLFFLLLGPGTIGTAHDTFARDQLAADNSVWSICSWHKNQQKMQIGGKTDETGWPVYEEC